MPSGALGLKTIRSGLKKEEYFWLIFGAGMHLENARFAGRTGQIRSVATALRSPASVLPIARLMERELLSTLMSRASLWANYTARRTVFSGPFGLNSASAFVWTLVQAMYRRTLSVQWKTLLTIATKRRNETQWSGVNTQFACISFLAYRCSRGEQLPKTENRFEERSSSMSDLHLAAKRRQ